MPCLILWQNSKYLTFVNNLLCCLNLTICQSIQPKEVSEGQEYISGQNKRQKNPFTNTTTQQLGHLPTRLEALIKSQTDFFLSLWCTKEKIQRLYVCLTLGLSHLETSVKKKMFANLKVGMLLDLYISFAIFLFCIFKLYMHIFFVSCFLFDASKMFNFQHL